MRFLNWYKHIFSKEKQPTLTPILDEMVDWCADILHRKFKYEKGTAKEIVVRWIELELIDKRDGLLEIACGDAFDPSLICNINRAVDDVNRRRKSFKDYVFVPKNETITVFINSIEHEISKTVLGAHLYNIGGLNNDFNLYLETPTGDVLVLRDRCITLKDQDKFHSTQKRIDNSTRVIHIPIDTYCIHCGDKVDRNSGSFCDRCLRIALRPIDGKDILHCTKCGKELGKNREKPENMTKYAKLHTFICDECFTKLPPDGEIKDFDK